MYRVGIDLGGTNIVVGIVDEEYHILNTAKCKTACPRPAREIIDDMIRLTREAVAAANLTMADIGYVGIGSPGTCNADTGVVEYANNLGFENVPVRDWMQAELKCPIYIENDANAAALGETLAGAAKGAASAICVTLGTGVGGGIVLDGHILRGFNFAGAEVGHTVIVTDGEPCSCGRKGCWEAYASATGLIRQTRRAMEAHPESKMWEICPDIARVNGRTAFDAMRRDDAEGKAVVDQYIKYVATGLVNMINIFQPETLCVGGGICNEGETLMAPLRDAIERERYSKYSKKQTRICVASLGNNAGLIGAAALGEER